MRQIRGLSALVRERSGSSRGRAIGLRICVVAVIAATVSLLGAAGASAQDPTVKVLVFHGAADPTVDAGVAAIEELGADNDFAVETSADAADFTPGNLGQYRAIVFLGNSGDQLNAAQETALQAYIQDGGGFVGIGGAAEAEPGSTFFGNLIGARPAAGSPTGTSQQVVAVGDRVHPANDGLPLEWTRSDVWYQWQTRPTGQVHTIARYHAPDAPAGDGTATGGTDWPISWCRDFQGGRSFYTGMGRTAASYGESDFRTHLLGAIQWSSGMIRAGCKATIAANYKGERLVDGSSGDLAHTGESHGVAMAPNGWAIYIGRGDCRTDAQRGAMIGAGPTPRILDFANRNVGIGCGDVHIWDPEAYNGTVNSGDTLAGLLPVYGDRGGGAEINGKFESGMLGVTVAPDFATTGHIYLQWFPTLNPDNPVHPGVADGDQRRITKMGQGRVSRFTIDLETKKLDLDSEVVIFTYDTQIWSCCHQGGGMGFDSEGNLYVTVGDSNSSQSTNGYSGNFQPARCPTGDPAVASNSHCGSNNISYNDARRTAGSTNDYNGKMLRFNPIDTIPDGAQPQVGVGTTYSLPTGDSPNGPNLFNGDEGGGGKAKPEIYAMGLRNPSRLFIDPETDIPYSAWVGPDAGSPSATQGPSTYENATQLAAAGNYGWPYCMGNQQAYRDRVADGSLRTANAAGYVNGGPAGAPTPGWYDCKNLVNDSTNNTGLTVLPHETGTGMDAGTARPTNLWYSRGNPEGRNGCPTFPREQGADGAPNYGATPTQLCPYLTASGATVFNGPVYRYDDDAEDNSMRWPQYWDGRWFLQDFGNASAKHGLLLDPATDQDGGKPVYADSLRGVLNWGANYMDSKFGPDGALYVQVYDGFFTTGPGAGLYRFSYTGGPDTPNPDPQWATAGTSREIRFSLGRSGGVAYEWDFGDGSPTSDEPSPSHTYAAAGTFNAKLTVTYADGEELSKTVQVIVGDDSAAPTTTAERSGDGPVEVTLSATDGAGGSGVEWTEYRVDGGAWTRSDNTGEDDPFVTTLTVRGDGDHTVEFRSRDRAGNVEDPPKSVSFTIEPDGGGPGCSPLSDQFGGSELDPKWELVNPNPTTQPSVADGQLTLPLVPGDLYGGTGSAQMILQQAPADSWVATAKVAHANVDTDGEAAGLALINRLDPNSFVKTAVQYKSDTDPDTPGDQPGKWAERVLTSDGGAVVIPPETVPWPNSGALNLTGDYVWVRFVHDAEANTITTWTSTNGTAFTQFGAAIDVEQYLNQPGGLRVGLFGKHDGSGDDEVGVDAFNVVSGTADPQTPGDDCGAGGECPQTDEFDGTALGDRWEVVNPNPAALAVGGGNVTLTSAPGDVRNTSFTAQNILLQDVPEGPWTATMKFDHTALASNGQAAGMVVYGQRDPNYFAKIAAQYKDTDLSGNPMNGIWVERALTTNGAANSNYGGQFPNTGKLEPPTDNLWIRASYDGTNVISEYSLDGETWAPVAPPVPANEYGPNGVTKIGLFVKHDNGGTPAEVAFDSFGVDAESCGETGDTTPPRTTHELDPAEPNGDNDWYTSPVEVTLNATDNEGGSGVDVTEYRFAGDEEWTTYTGPVTVDDAGRHTIEYRSTDQEGNTESIKSVTFRIDPTAPTTTAKLNGEAPKPDYDGPVEVDLDATDGDGSGVRETEIRVDGGEWQPYVEEETILNSAADLEKWEQAGPGGLNWTTDEGGFARTSGGLGMPWYPVKDFGDFSLKLQWRDSSTGANGNSGVFVRFPNPTEAVSRPAGERYPCQVGSATSDPAWVAIFCGHEIQINDHQGDAQKTGSIYNFSPNDATQAQVQPKGTWVDYEVRVVGQQYTIIRNGTVIKQFLNAPDQQSTRPGDPPTNDRQFARGYIGLQNHGGSDVIDFRNVRVLPLDEGSARGPVTVEGDGEHTVEYRSTDVAGNQEATKKVDFTIGGAADDETPPVTSHALDPAQPGAGGTYDGPVDVTLSATDPAEGGAEPVTHDVDANGFSWTPNSVDATAGDVVRWNFPEATAGFPHDVWVIKPGEAPDSAGTQVTDGAHQPGDEPVSTTVDQAGDWTYLCKLHSSVQDGHWTGMVGTAHVAEGTGPTEGSGVDFTEYRVNTGDWVRSDNAGGDDPFETSFTVEDEGSHVVEYRSTDNAGNQEAIKSVAFSIAAADPDAPSVEGFADPATGAAPLLVQFSATGLDPQGGPLDYEWDFDDNGSGSFEQSPQHTYRAPGTYQATVTATDRQGKTGSAVVTVVVSETGNQAPVARATADPKSGQAPLAVQFSATATDDRPTGELTYLWDFDDGGASALGRSASHTYTRPGTYHATVTVTDRGGAFDTEEVVITVENPPGNVPPTVQAAATPRSGAAPLRVSFSSSAVDPDGDQVSTVWDFGDGVKAGGANIAHTYTQPGNYTATVTVKDPGGLTATDSVTITVSTTARSAPQGSPPSRGDDSGESTDQPLVRGPRSKGVRSVIKRGLRLRVTCDDTETCRAKSVLRVSGERLGASKAVRIGAGKSRTVVIRLDRTVRRNLVAAMRQAGIRRLKATAVTKLASTEGMRTVRVKVQLKR